MGNCWSFVYEQTKSIFILRKPNDTYMKNPIAKSTIAKKEEVVQELRVPSQETVLKPEKLEEEPYIRMRNDGNKDLPKLHSDIIIQVESDLGDEFVYVDA